MRSSMLGCVAAVTAIVSPSQPRPAVIHNTSISEIGSDSFPAAPEFNAKGVISPQLGTETCLELVRWTGGSRNEHECYPPRILPNSFEFCTGCFSSVKGAAELVHALTECHFSASCFARLSE